MDQLPEGVPIEYRPLSPWAYFGYNFLFAIPVVGLILLIVFALDNTNINRRNYARSFFCALIIMIPMFILIFVSVGMQIINMIQTID